MRVAMVHSFYRERDPSGENEQVLAEVDALRRAGEDVHLVAAHTDELEERPGYRLRSALRVATGIGSSPLGHIESFRPDVVHIHNLFPNFGRTWVRRLSVPFVCSLHNFRFVCANALLYRNGRVCTECLDGRPWAGFAHACYRGSRIASAPAAIQAARGVADPVLAHAARIICLSPRQAGFLERAGVGAERLVRGANFLPVSLDPGTEADSACSREGWLFVGRLSEEKGILDLVRSWPADGPRLLVIGDGPLRVDVELAATRRPVELLGKRPRAEVLARLRHVVGLVLPSTCYEIAPLIVIEALSAGALVAVTGAADVDHQAGEGAAIVHCEVGAIPNLEPAPTAAREQFERSYSEETFVSSRLALYRAL